jgi:hypothetical protein
LSRRDKQLERQNIRLPYGRAATIISIPRPKTLILFVARSSSRSSRHTSATGEPAFGVAAMISRLPWLQRKRCYSPTFKREMKAASLIS